MLRNAGMLVRMHESNLRAIKPRLEKLQLFAVQAEALEVSQFLNDASRYVRTEMDVDDNTTVFRPKPGSAGPDGSFLVSLALVVKREQHSLGRVFVFDKQCARDGDLHVLYGHRVGVDQLSCFNVEKNRADL